MDIEKIVESNIEKHKEEISPPEEIQKSEIIAVENIPIKEVAGFTNTINTITQSFVPDNTKSVNEQAKEAVDVLTVGEAVKDRATVEELTKHKKDELVFRAEANAKEEKAKSKGSEINLQKAEFGVYEGIASYAGIKKSLPKGMQKILMIPLQIIVGILLFIFGSVASAVNVILDCVNAIMIRFADLSESSKKVVKNVGLFLLISMVLGGLYLGIKALLQHYGIWFD